jgi:hypothetical protein
MGKENIIVGVVGANGLGVGNITVSAYGASKASGVNLGLSDGGIEVDPKSATYKVEVDQAVGAIDEYMTEKSITIKANIAEAALSAIGYALGEAASSLAGSVLSVGNNFVLTKYTVYIDVKGVNGGTRAFVIPMATISGDAKQSYKRKDKVMIPITINGLVDLTQAAGQELWYCTDSAINTTAPTIVLTTPAAGGTVTKVTKGTVLLTITSPNVMAQSTLVYGVNINIVNVTTVGTPVLTAGTVVYDATAKTVTFTPTSNWTASDKLEIVCSGIKDQFGNILAAPYIAAFTVTA